MPLTAVQVRNAKPGRHADERGLYLLVKPSGARSWVLRVQADGRRRDLGLGPADLVPLAEARELAREGRRMVRDGLDPAAEWKRRKAGPTTFEAVARKYHDAVKGGWRNPKHAAQWLSTMEAHVFGPIGAMPVERVDSAAILRVLTPIWHAVPETARRVRQRIGATLDYAYSQGLRSAEAPMRAVSKGLGKQPAGRGSFAAMPYAEVPALMRRLEGMDETVSRLALRFTILTAARSGEVRGATWGEVDMAARLWTRPAARMKAGKDHAIPLPDEAVAILERLSGLFGRAPGELLFPSTGGRPLSDMTLAKALKAADGDGYTVHGMRSSFRDWVAERLPTVPGEVAEAALAHSIPNKVEAAYRRTQFIDQRRELMQRWADYLMGQSNVLQLARFA